MTMELATQQESVLLLHEKAMTTKNSLVIADDATYQEWESIGELLGQIEGAVHWWIGDWLNFGDRKYGEMYTQALEETDYKYSTLATDKWISNQFEFSRRRENLSWSHHIEVAGLEPEEQDELLDKAEKHAWTRSQLRSEVRNIKHQNIEVKRMVGKYGVIYLDPPWDYSNSGFDNAAAAQYPTMTEQELCALEEVAHFSDDTTVLFMWATNPLLDVAIRVMSAWGYEYKTNFAWVKDKARGNAWWAKSKHELLLVGTRVNSPIPVTAIDSAIQADRPSRHSQKPEDFYELIETAFPKANKIEMFARGRREGWSYWGNEDV